MRTAKTLGIVAVVVLSAATIVAYREGWLARARVRLAPFFERSRASEAVPSTSPTPAKVGTEAPPGYNPGSAPEFPEAPLSPGLLAALPRRPQPCGPRCRGARRKLHVSV